jgi:orotate phosphoribosyltransferase
MTNKEEVIKIFESSGALTRGHFILRSGLHSGHYFQCAAVGQFMDKISRLTELLVDKLKNIECDTILAPAMGGLVIGQEVARQLGKRYLFVEKVNDKLELRRGFKINKGEKIIVVEDVITRGGRVNEALEIVKKNGGTSTAVAVLVDRSNGDVDFGIPLIALIEMSFPTYQAEQLPEDLKKIPAIKPGS